MPRPQKQKQPKISHQFQLFVRQKLGADSMDMKVEPTETNVATFYFLNDAIDWIKQNGDKDKLYKIYKVTTKIGDSKKEEWDLVDQWIWRDMNPTMTREFGLSSEKHWGRTTYVNKAWRKPNIKYSILGSGW